MGSDTPPPRLYEAVGRAAEHLEASDTLVVFATEAAVLEITRQQSPHPISHPKAHIQFHLVKEVVTMGDEPLSVVKQKTNSSLAIGIRLLKRQLLDAFVSTGNTGALIAAATLSMPRLPGIKRPALIAMLPSEKGPVAVIDVGGNVSCKAKHLIQFALMGAAYQRCSKGIEHPTVGLLNIGVESRKGTEEIQKAYHWLTEQRENLNMTFQGNIEGREVLQGVVDVVVTDGFTGNVLLKSIEGTSSFILENITKKHGHMEGMRSALQDLHKRFHYAEYPGAIVCGVDGVVVKCHGDSCPTALFNGIRGAVKLVRHQLVQKIKQQLSESSI
jgi:glycerol-3-phosphate acyltransferase PlsX